MTTTKIDVMTAEEKRKLREKLEQHIKEYEANGGEITQCPPNAYTETDADGKPRKFSSLHTPDSITDPIKRTIGGFVPRKKEED